MELYQKLKEVIMASDMGVVDKAYTCTALDDIAEYVMTDDFTKFYNNGISGDAELENRRGAINLAAALEGLSKYHCSDYRFDDINGMYIRANADVIEKCFEKNGLTTDSIVNEAVESLCCLNVTQHLKTSVPDARLSDIHLSPLDAKSFAEQEMVWRYTNRYTHSMSDVTESKLLDTNVDLFLDLFSEESRVVAFITALFRKMSDEQLRNVYDCL